jgi:PKD domain
MVTDDHGLSANATTYAVIAKRNGVPGTPTISGPAEGIAGAAYNFTLASKDPDGDDIVFIIDWGDGNTTRTVPTLGENATIVNHTWSVPGFFNITVRAVDGSNATSEPARHMIQVTPTPAPVPGDDRKDGGQMALYLALAAMIMIIVSALALYMYWRKRKDKGKEAPDDMK